VEDGNCGVLTGGWLPLVLGTMPGLTDGNKRWSVGGGRNNELCGQLAEKDVGRFDTTDPTWFGSTTGDEFPVQSLPAPSDGCDAADGMRNIGGPNARTSARLPGVMWEGGRIGWWAG